MPPTIEQTLDSSLQPALLELWLNGLYTAIFLATMTGLYRRRRKEGENGWFIATITVVMYTLATLNSSVFWKDLRAAFVFQGSANGIAAEAKKLASSPLGLFLSRLISFSLNTLIADCLFIWRSWVIWGRDWRVIVPSGILTIIGTVFSVLADVAQVSLRMKQGPSASGFASNKFFVDTGTVYLALSFGTTLVVTVLIIYRILSIDRMNRSAMGGTYEVKSTMATYSSIVEIVVESSLLYSIAEFVLFVLLAKGSPSYVYAEAVVVQITGIAPTLILARISFGLARPSSSWMQTRTTMHFATRTSNTGSEVDEPGAIKTSDSL